METPNPTQVKPPAVFCGLDIAKKSFVAALAQDDPRRAPTAKFANDAHGYAEFLTWLYARAAAGTVIRISMEATGAYWIALATHLKAEARLVVCVHNPQLIKRFMTSFGGRAKTDRIDAALIARFAQERARVAWVPKDTEQARLCELARAYDDYGLALQGFKTRDQQAVHTEVRANFPATVKYLLVEQKKIREAMLAIVSASVELSAKAELLMTIPGIATLSSAQILAELPFELIGSGRQLAAYAGLVPAIEQSGTSVNKSKLSAKWRTST